LTAGLKILAKLLPEMA
jgi:hypothetical protein